MMVTYCRKMQVRFFCFVFHNHFNPCLDKARNYQLTILPLTNQSFNSQVIKHTLAQFNTLRDVAGIVLLGLV